MTPVARAWWRHRSEPRDRRTPLPRAAKASPRSSRRGWRSVPVGVARFAAGSAASARGPSQPGAPVRLAPARDEIRNLSIEVYATRPGSVKRTNLILPTGGACGQRWMKQVNRAVIRQNLDPWRRSHHDSARSHRSLLFCTIASASGVSLDQADGGAGSAGVEVNTRIRVRGRRGRALGAREFPLWRWKLLDGLFRRAMKPTRPTSAFESRPPAADSAEKRACRGRPNRTVAGRPFRRQAATHTASPRSLFDALSLMASASRTWHPSAGPDIVAELSDCQGPPEPGFSVRSRRASRSSRRSLQARLSPTTYSTSTAATCPST
jgi:hypothetical protein